MRILVGQLRVKTGDLVGNVVRARAILANYGDLDNCIAILPETSITGYNCGALFETRTFVRDAQVGLTKFATNFGELYPTASMLIGTVRMADQAYERNGEIRLHNTAAFITGGKVTDYHDKVYMANAAHHEDRKYWHPGNKPHIQEFWSGDDCQHVGVLTCEDIWRDDHDVDLMGQLKADNPDMTHVIVLNCSYFTPKKIITRMNLLRSLALDHQVSILYVNCVGVGDIAKNIMIYDGASMYVNQFGIVAKMFPQFEEAHGMINTDELDMITIDCAEAQKYIDLSRNGNLKWQQIVQALIYGTRMYHQDIRIPRIQLHVSGGIDSAINAYIAVKAVGAENCDFITNPSSDNDAPSIQRAMRIADTYGIHMKVDPMNDVVNAVLASAGLARGAGGLREPNKLAVATAQSVGRTVVGLVESNQHGGIGIISCGNHTENVTGWFNTHDIGSIGTCAPLGDLTKVELFVMSAFINDLEGQEMIPEELFNGDVLPGAGLADSQVDPFDYDIVSGICAVIIRNRMTGDDIVNAWRNRTLDPDAFDPHLEKVYAMSERAFYDVVADTWRRSGYSVYKCAQSAPVFVLHDRSRGFSHRETLINYYVGAMTPFEG